MEYDLGIRSLVEHLDLTREGKKQTNEIVSQCGISKVNDFDLIQYGTDGDFKTLRICLYGK